MTSSRTHRWHSVAAAGLLVLLPAAVGAAGDARAPEWPHLLSEAGRRAAMALPKSSPWHLEPSLQDLEDQAAAEQSRPSAKARYDQWIAAAGLPPNVRANNPAGDVGAPAADTQSECAVAAFGNRVVVAWNDSKGLRLGSPTTVTSYAFSCDSGQSFTDGGDVPLLGAGHQSFGDCTLDVDASGNFYLGVIYVGATQDVAVYRGTFGGAGCTFTWQNPVIAANGAAGALDKPYLCVDPANGNVYCSFTRFGATTNIEVVRGTVLGTVWTAPIALETSATTSGLQGSRPAIGPEGNLYVAWQAGWGFINCDLSSVNGEIHLRRSTNPAGAMGFGAVVVVGTAQMNWTSYWAGNLRNNAIFFPDMAVDRSGGAHNGNVYVAWHEAAPWGPPGAGTGVSQPETEANNTPSDAGVKTLALGDNATGNISASGDFDYWRINVAAGQHVMLRLEPQGFNCGVAGTTRNFQLRLFKGIVGTAGDSILANSNISGFVSEIVFDAAETATYLVRVRNVNTAGTVTGTYTVKTRALTYGAPSPARDMRDVVCARSTNLGVSFSPEVRVNDDAANLDNCIPAITVDRVGKVHVFFYDSRHGLGARILRTYVQAISTNGGVSYNQNHRLSSQLQYFNLNTVAVPNYGEYNQACTAQGTTVNRVYASWSDERLANANTSGVDAYVALLQNCLTVSCAAPQTVASGGSVNFQVCVTNCGTFADDVNYSISDTQGWTTPVGSSVNVTAGSSVCFTVTANPPPATPDGTISTLTFNVASQTCPATTANCTTTITASNPIPLAGLDCHSSQVVMALELYDVLPGGGTYSTTVPFGGNTMIHRSDPSPSPPGSLIETEIVAMNLTGNDPLLGPLRLVESAPRPSLGEIQTAGGPPFPADSFFDVFFEIELPASTLFNRNRFHITGPVNAIPSIGASYHGGDILLYRHGPDESTVVGRVVAYQHDLGPLATCFPPPGTDCLNTAVLVQLQTPAMGIDNLQGTGTMSVTRGAPGDFDFDGRGDVPIEMIEMTLTGNGVAVGPFTLRTRPGFPTLGRIEEQNAGMLYPADSFFDVFFELDLPNAGLTLHPQTAVNAATTINAIPPIGSNYQYAAVPIPLLDPLNNPTGYSLLLWRHVATSTLVCAPPAGSECAPLTGQATIEVLGLGIDTVNLTGSTTVLRGPMHDPGGGQLVIDTEIVALELQGVSPLFGPVDISEDPAPASLGKTLGLNPGIMFPADSFFDVFFIVQENGEWLRPAAPVRMRSGAVPGLPVPPGTVYLSTTTPVDLVKGLGLVRGRLIDLTLQFGPSSNCTTDVPGSEAPAGAFYGLSAAYPNPFAREAQVRFQLDRERLVRMQVFDVGGHLVRSVYEGRLGAGPQLLHWDGRDGTGRGAGRGVYLYRFEVDGRSVTRKLVKTE